MDSNDIFLNKIEKVETKMKELEKALEKSSVHNHNEKMIALAKEHRQHQIIFEKVKIYRDILKKIEEDTELIQNATDIELKELAKEELEANTNQRIKLEQEIKLLLIPKDPNDKKNAALFAGDLFRMYSKFVEKQRWHLEVLGSNPTELGGFKEIFFAVNGDHAYGQMKFESGVHRVQRVPLTETGGRIHTSAASVVVFPEAEEVDVEIEPKDLRIDVYRSSGPGGQSVNTTDSAVRVTHIPTGIVVTCQDEKSQHKNKAKALKVLRARIFDIKQKEEQAKVAASRKSMIGSGDRSAKIRTYNFPQGRVTDHRINLTLYRLQEVLTGDLLEIIEKLQTVERDEKLKEGS
jgi:peptide chain release factor 1